MSSDDRTWENDDVTRRRENSERLEAAAKLVVPGGVYGHGALTTRAHPRFFESGTGAHVTDVDGNELIDFMCGYGPNLLGMGHPRVEAAAERQRRKGDCFSGPTARWVELAEALVERIGHADWAMFTKNGTDATTLCTTIARAATGRRKILVARGAYHGAAPWCTPSDAGVPAEDRAHLLHYRYNDLESVAEAVARAGDDLAGIMVSPFRHDTFVDQELPTTEFARGLRRACDRAGAVLMIDEVRAGLRLARGGSWERLSVDPDLSAWGKALGNGYAISAVVGREDLRDAARRVYATGSFWYGGVAMAAACETLAVADEIGLPEMLTATGQQFRAGLEELATANGFSLRQTGPPQLPMVLFEGDTDFSLGKFFTGDAIDRGVYMHPYHNMFLSAAHTPAIVAEALERLSGSFESLRRYVDAAGPEGSR